MEHAPKHVHLVATCSVCGTTGYEANSPCPLHAAAPELLKALKQTAFEAHQRPGHNGGLKRCLHGTCRQARAAIKAARKS